MKEKLSRREVLVTAGAMAVGVAAEHIVGGDVSIAEARGGNAGSGPFPTPDSSPAKRKHMVISTIVENYLFNDDLKCRHGLSLLIQLDNGPTVLFDAGPDDALLFNMSVLKHPFEEIDFIIISHGHRDHGGGLKYVLERNPSARVCLHEKCTGKFFSEKRGEMRSIGFYDDSLPEKRMDFITQDKKIHPRLQIFVGFERSGFFPTGNQNLYMQKDDAFLHDDFEHEIVLLLHEKENNVLITGCSHSGIGNIICSVLKRSGLKKIEHVIGGFHLTTPSSGKSEYPEKVQQLADELNQFPETKFYTGHCTGKKQIEHLRFCLTPELFEINTGSVLRI